MKSGPFSLLQGCRLWQAGSLSRIKNFIFVLQQDSGKDQIPAGQKRIIKRCHVGGENIGKEISGDYIPLSFSRAPFKEICLIDVY